MVTRLDWDVPPAVHQLFRHPAKGETNPVMIVIGIDAHKRTHTAVVANELGRKLATKTVGTTSADHLALLR